MVKLKQDEFYCLSCNKKCKGDDIKFKYIKNSKRKVPTIKGYCHKCDCKVSKIVKNNAVQKLKSKY